MFQRKKSLMTAALSTASAVGLLVILCRGQLDRGPGCSRRQPTRNLPSYAAW